jgi:hypothetical protein
MAWECPREVLAAFLKAFPEQRRFGKATSGHLAKAMESGSLSPEKALKRIEAWRRVHANIPPWLIADVPPSPEINTGLFAPEEDQPEKVVAPADLSSRGWAEAQTSKIEVEDV